MRIRLAVPDVLDDLERKDALDAALESVTRSNVGLLRRGIVPTAAAAIKAGKVRWAPEPPGDEHFDLPTTVLKRGAGDCDDLAPWHCAALRASGTDPGARAIVRKSGPNRWHAIVQRSDGSIEDPSRAAGMGHSVSGPGGGAGAPIHTPMSADPRLVLALTPNRDRRYPPGWVARCDAPDRCEPWNWSASSYASDPAQALVQTISTVRGVCGEEIDGVDLARIESVNDLILGADPEEVGEALAEILGEEAAEQILGEAEDSVGFFGGLARGLGKLAKGGLKLMPFASKAVQFIPGVGPVISTAMDAGAGLANAAMRSHARPSAPSPGWQQSPVTPQPYAQFGTRFAQFAAPHWAPPSFMAERGQLFQPSPVSPNFMVF